MRRDLQTDAGGEVVEPDVHDAKFNGISLRGKDAVIELETAQGKQLNLVLIGVQRLVADGFREGNIVLDIVVAKGTPVDAAEVAAAYGVHPAGQAFLKDAVERVCNGTLVLFTLNPSYGCSLSSLCDRVEVEDSP